MKVKSYITPQRSKRVQLSGIKKRRVTPSSHFEKARPYEDRKQHHERNLQDPGNVMTKKQISRRNCWHMVKDILLRSSRKRHQRSHYNDKFGKSPAQICAQKILRNIKRKSLDCSLFNWQLEASQYSELEEGEIKSPFVRNRNRSICDSTLNSTFRSCKKCYTPLKTKVTRNRFKWTAKQVEKESKWEKAKAIKNKDKRNGKIHKGDTSDDDTDEAPSDYVSESGVGGSPVTPMISTGYKKLNAIRAKITKKQIYKVQMKETDVQTYTDYDKYQVISKERQEELGPSGSNNADQKKCDELKSVAIRSPPRPLPFKNRKRQIIIDGSNIAFSHGRNQFFSVKGIKIAIEHLENVGHQVKCVMPSYRKNFNKSSDPALLEDLHNSGRILYTPCKNLPNLRSASYDDRFILEIAVELDAAIISNDNYRDLLTVSEEFKRTIETRVITYMFCEDFFILANDPYGKNGPKLHEILNL